MQLIIGDWALGGDDLQWTLYRRRTRRSGAFWNPISFVHSTRDILARCMREKGVDDDTARLLLSGLPDTFDEWNATHRAPQGSTLAPEAKS